LKDKIEDIQTGHLCQYVQRIHLEKNENRDSPY